MTTLQVVSSLKVNQAYVSGDRKPASFLDAAAPSAPEDDPGFDERMVTKTRDRRRKATFEFVQEGVFQKQAEMMRCAGNPVAWHHAAASSMSLPHSASPLPAL